MEGRPVFITDHALRQLRKRWPTAKNMADRALIQMVQKSLRETTTRVRLPGGVYVPFTLDGREGFLVLNDKEDKVKTAMGKEYCSEVCRFLKEQHG